jgi:hypothetical protein
MSFSCAGVKTGEAGEKMGTRKFVGGQPRAIAHATYLKFGRRYGIPTGGKSFARLAQEIYDWERRRGVGKGLYFRPA